MEVDYDTQHYMQQVSKMIDAPKLRAQLQRELAGCQSPPHEVLMFMCIKTGSRRVVHTCMPHRSSFAHGSCGATPCRTSYDAVHMRMQAITYRRRARQISA